MRSNKRCAPFVPVKARSAYNNISTLCRRFPHECTDDFTKDCRRTAWRRCATSTRSFAQRAPENRRSHTSTEGPFQTSAPTRWAFAYRRGQTRLAKIGRASCRERVKKTALDLIEKNKKSCKKKEEYS